MNMFTNRRWQGHTRALTFITLLAMIMGAFPVPFFVAEAATNVFSDGFETNDFSSWTYVDEDTDKDWKIVGGTSVEGSHKARVKGSTTPSAILRKDISTEGYENLALSFYHKDAGFESGDFVAVEYSPDAGSSWTNIETFNDSNEVDDNSNNAWVIFSDSLPSDASDNPDFQLRFRSSLDASNDSFDLDDVVINGDEIPGSCTPQHEVAGPTDIENTDTGEYFETIQNAIDDCDTTDGHTVDVATGTYVEDLDVYKELTFEGNGASTIDGSMTVSAENVTVNGFTITNPDGTKGIFADGVGNLTITNNTFSEIGSDSSVANNVHAFWYQDDTDDVTNLDISNNTFDTIGHDQGRSATAIGVGDSTGDSHVTGVTIEGNTISNVVARHDFDYSGGGRGAYGILINHARSSHDGTTADVVISGNDISNLEGLWVHAIGLEGETPDALVTGNDISDLTEHKLALEGTLDGVGIFFEQNNNADTVQITQNNFYTDGSWLGVAVHPAMTGTYPVDAEENYWNTLIGSEIASSTYAPDDISVDYQEWLCEPAPSSNVSVDGTCVVEPELEITNPATDYETLSGEHTFEAEYTDDDDTEDTIHWAIKPEACEAGNPDSNLAGYGTPGYAPASYNPITGHIEMTVDMSSWDNGNYCLVVNPLETGGETDTEREVRYFTLSNEIDYCSVTVVSDETNYVEETDGNAALAWVHGAWSAVIDSASWIWGTEYVENPDTEEVQTFTKDFEWSGAVALATLEIATDNFYEVYLNGDFVASSTELGLFKEENKGNYDVSSYVDEGVNTLEIVVTNKAGDDNPEVNPAGLLYNLTIVSDEEGDACMTAPVDASLEITSPATDYETLSGEHTFTADYIDADDDNDSVLWAIRAGSCSAGTNTVAGNVDGFNTDYDWDGTDFSSTIDMSSWDDGDYCFVVNPQESSGEDFRETRWFTLSTPVVAVCEPGVNLLENPSFEEPAIDSAWALVDPVGWIAESVATLNPLPDMEIQRNVNGWLASDGDQYTELDSTESSRISQVIPTVLGATYRLAWDFAARPDTFQSNNDLRVLVDGVEMASDSAPGVSPLEWRDGAIEFTGTGATTTITFADAGESDALGTFLDNTSLLCDPEPTAGPYCGDGEVNQEWEQCEPGDKGCTDYCTFADQCLDPDLQLAKITFDTDAPDSASFDGTVYLGADDNPVPSGVWFSLDEEDTTPVHTIAKEVDGLAVRRSSSSLHLAVAGGNEPRDIDYVLADIEFVGVDVNSLIDANEFDPDPLIGWPLETSGSYPDVFSKDDNTVRMEWYLDVGNDAAGLTYEAEPYCTAEDPTYVIEGYAWHDHDEDGLWDDREQEEDSDESEDGLSGWTIEATNGSTTYSTTTDSTGYYWFEVPAGTWTITEELQEGWATTSTSTHVVTVPGEPEELTLLDTIMSFIIPTAHAAIEGYYGYYNFGNNEVATTDDGGSSSGGGSSSSSSGGYFPNGRGGATDGPVPQVLGEQVSMVPSGAPDAGAGGTAPATPGITLLQLLYVRRSQPYYGS